MVELKELQEALFRGDILKVKEIIQKALWEKIEPKEILEQGLITGMKVVGIKFKNNEIFLPEVLLASQAMYGGLELLQPKLIKSGVKAVGKVIIGTAKGDLHDIGKNLVDMMLRGGGFEVIDLGIDVTPEKFLKASQERKPDYNVELLEKFLKMTDHIHIPKIIGIMPLKSYEMVEYLNNNLPGIFVPPEVKERMRGKDVEEGVKISRELISEIRKFKEAAGVHIFPLRDMNLVCRLLN